MQTFDNALYKLAKQGIISQEEALKNADSRNNLRLKFTLDADDVESDVLRAEKKLPAASNNEKVDVKTKNDPLSLSLEPLAGNDENDKKKDDDQFSALS